MLNQPTLDKLKRMRLHGMCRAVEQQQNDLDIDRLSFEDRLGLLIDAEEAARETTKLKNRLKNAKPRTQACLENIKKINARGLDKTTLAALGGAAWLDQGLNVLIAGATGVGKTYLTCAVINAACRNGKTALYTRSQRLMQDLAIARAAGTYRSELLKLAKVDLLAIDDFGLICLPDDNSRDLLEVIDDRAPTKSTIIASQLPLDHWHQTISNPTIADAILDRVVHNSYKIKMKGESVRPGTAFDTEEKEA